MSRDKFSSKLVYKNAIYSFAGKNYFFIIIILIAMAKLEDQMYF
jgi:hypothetical protein